MNITLRQIQAFLAVAELGSFTRAADRLGMSQPALSQLVRELEGHIGLRLVDRTTRRTEVAESAVDFEHAVRNVILQLENVVKSAMDVATLRLGRLSVAAPPTFSSIIMPPAIAEFSQAHPGVQLVLVDTSEAIEELVAKGLVDLGLGTFSPEEEAVDRNVLMRDTLNVIVSRRSPLAASHRVEWSSLNGLPLVGLTVESGIRRLVDQSFAAMALEPSYAFTVQSINTALSFVDADLGVAILPSYAMTLRGDKNIVAIELGSPTVSRDISLIKRRGRSMTPAAKRFSEIIRKWTRIKFPGNVVERTPDGENAED